MIEYRVDDPPIIANYRQPIIKRQSDRLLLRMKKKLIFVYTRLPKKLSFLIRVGGLNWHDSSFRM